MCKKSKVLSIVIPSLLVLCLVMIGTTPGYSAKYETISATAFGTDTQVGQLVTVTLVIYQYSTDQDRQVLIEAFQKGQSQGVADALSKMKPAGHIDASGTPGFDVGFIRLIKTPTGRKIRFITNRRIGCPSCQTAAFDLTAGEFDIDDQNKKKSSGTLFPAAQLIINKQGELQFELNQNAWRFAAIRDWPGTAEN